MTGQKRKRKICVVTATRAEYGLLHWLMREIQQDDELELQIIAGGMHLAPEFGLTYKEIEDDGFTIDEKLEFLLASDTPVGIGKSMGLGTISYTDALSRLNPDVVVVLGDRFELFAACQAAMVLKIPIAHIHGGELTLGAMDDAIRHAVTKLAHLHFVSAEPYRKRIIQMGEHPDTVFNFGAPGLDYIQHLDFVDAKQLEDFLDMELTDPTFLVTYHPVTLMEEDPLQAVQAICEALDAFPEAKVVFTKPNADAGNRVITAELESYAKRHRDRVRVVSSLGQQRYLSLVRYSAAVIGNSSSGLIEVPLLGTPTVNIGKRQEGRLRGKSVVDVEPHKESIIEGIRQVMSNDFRSFVQSATHPYGAGDASSKIKAVLKACDVDGLLLKHFYDLP